MPDLAAARAFFVDTLGFAQAGELRVQTRLGIADEMAALNAQRHHG